MPVLPLGTIGKTARRGRRRFKLSPFKLPHLPFQLPRLLTIPPQYRNLLRAFFLGLLLALPLVWYFRLHNSQQAAAWWDDAWAYRRRVDLTNNTSSNLTDFQVSFTLDTATLISNNKLQSQCQDLRLTDHDGHPIPFWIEENNPGCNSTNTKIWVKVPDLPASGGRIYVYYGNNTANTSNLHDGNRVFLMFDDFSSDNGSWQTLDGTVSFSAGEITFAPTATGSTSWNHTATSDQDNISGLTSYIVEHRYKSAKLAGGTVFRYIDDNNWFGLETGYNDRIQIRGYIDGLGRSGITGAHTYPINTYVKFTTKYDGSTHNVKVLADDTQIVDYTFNSTDQLSQTNKVGIVDHRGYGPSTSDWIFVRKYASADASATLAAEETPRGPAAYWKFDEGTADTCPSGTDICDSSGRGNHGNIVGDTTWMSEDRCISGKCLLFDGSGDRVDIPDSVSLSPTKAVTIQGWFNVNATPGDEGKSTPYFGMIQKDGGYSGFGNYGIRFRSEYEIEGMLVDGSAVENTNSITTTDTLEKNKWYFVAMTYDQPSATWRIYINGELVYNSTSYFGELLYDSPDPFRIGMGDGRYWSGLIDEVKVYPYARTQEQIHLDYNSSAAGAGSAVVIGAVDQQSLGDGLVGYWPMDETSGTTVADASGNGNDGTLVNAQEVGTSDGSGNSTTTLIDSDGVLSASDDAYNNMFLEFTAACGNITSGTKRIINDYTGSTKTFTLSSALEEAPNGCAYQILHQVGGKFGNGVAFDGYDASIEDSSYFVPTTHSVGMWLKPAIINHNHYFFSFDNYHYSIRVNVNGNIVYTTYSSQYEDCTSNNTLDANSWNHVLITNESGVKKIFINGSLDNTCSQGISNKTGKNVALRLGRVASTVNYRGLLDEVRIYNRTLSASEVSQLYNFAPGPIGYWDFEEGEGGTAHDQSGNEHHGTLTNMSVGSSWVDGRLGKALQFDGQDDYINLGNPDSLNISGGTGRTLCSWIKPYSVNLNQYFVSLNYVKMFIGLANDGRFLFGTYNTQENYEFLYSSSAATLNNWYYVCGVLHPDGNKELFIDGALAGTGTASSIHSHPVWTYSAIGSRGNNNNGLYTHGVLDEVKIYNYARTPAQIRQDMQGSAISSIGSSTGGSMPKPVAHWSFDEGSGTTAHDKFSEETNLNQLQGDPQWTSLGKVNSAMIFDGDDAIRTAASTRLGMSDNLTMSAWIKPTQAPENNGFFMGRYYEYGFYIDKNLILRAQLRSSTPEYEYFHSGTSVPLNEWSHVGLTFNKGAVKIYLNGEEVFDGTLSTSDLYQHTSAHEVVGAYYNLTSNPYIGLVDEVKIYNIALTPEQIAQDMNQGSSTSFGGGSNTNTEAADLADGAGDPPVAEWRFNEKQGTTTHDTSGNGNDGTINGATWQSAHRCHEGACLEFDGSGQSVVVPDNPNLTITNAWTIESWALIRNTNTYRRLLSKSQEWGIQITTTNQIKIIANATNALLTTSSPVQLNTWQHIAARYDGENVNIYVNGTEVASATYNSDTSDTTDDLVIGGGYSTEWWDGLIDHVKIYDYARTPAQIAYDYNRGKPVAHWKFDECQGSVAHDSSGNDNHGTITIGATGSQTTVGTCETSGAWGNGASGKFNSGMSFDGSDDYIALPNDLNYTDQVSAFAWFKSNGSPGGGYHIIFGGSQLEISIPNSTGEIRTGVYTGTRHVSNHGSGLLDGEWHHIGFTFDGSIKKSYIDGEFVGEQTGITGTLATSFDRSIGRFGTSNAYWANGNIDDARIYNYALSDDQVKKLYNNDSAFYFGD